MADYINHPSLHLRGRSYFSSLEKIKKQKLYRLQVANRQNDCGKWEVNGTVMSK